MTYPRSEFYKIDETLTAMGIGQALVTVLNSKGIPTEVAYTHLVPPVAVMGPLDDAEANALMHGSEMYKKYFNAIDPTSAVEILNRRMRGNSAPETQNTQEETVLPPKPSAERKTKEKSVIEEVMSSSVTRSIGRELVRGLFGVLFGKTTTRRRR
jgi:hypothetical protein